MSYNGPWLQVCNGTHIQDVVLDIPKTMNPWLRVHSFDIRGEFSLMRPQVLMLPVIVPVIVIQIRLPAHTENLLHPSTASKWISVMANLLVETPAQAATSLAFGTVI